MLGSPGFWYVPDCKRVSARIPGSSIKESEKFRAQFCYVFLCAGGVEDLLHVVEERLN